MALALLIPFSVGMVSIGGSNRSRRLRTLATSSSLSSFSILVSRDPIIDSKADRILFTSTLLMSTSSSFREATVRDNFVAKALLPLYFVLGLLFIPTPTNRLGLDRTGSGFATAV